MTSDELETCEEYFNEIKSSINDINDRLDEFDLRLDDIGFTLKKVMWYIDKDDLWIVQSSQPI